jgi:tubulin polyglutamylase TTLL4
MRKKFPKDFDYMPETYSYPENKKEIEKKFSNYKLDLNDLWLIKPKSGSLGEGIYIFENFTKIPDVYLITRYISNPHLINKLKYDFRIYVLITGLAPLKVYLYKEGMVRFATDEYNLDKNHLSHKYSYLTNVNINQKNKQEYKKATNADTQEGSKWSLQVYEDYCNNNNIDYMHIRKQMGDIAIKSVLSVHEQFLNRIKENETQDRNHFKLLGFDFLLDENMKVHLIEINSRPSLLMGDINDRKLKPQLIADCLNIIGIIPYSHEYKDGFAPFDNKDDNEDVNNLNDKKRIKDAVDISLCEFGRPRGRFELIFPLKDNIDKYSKLFKLNLIENKLFWEHVKNNS